MRIVLALLVLIAGTASARAQVVVCPFVTIGWSKQWFGQPISSASYDSAQQLLYVVFSTQFVSAFSNVPQGVITGFSTTSNPMSYYLSAVQPQYHSLLLAQTNNCPVLYESGAYVWTK